MLPAVSPANSYQGKAVVFDLSIWNFGATLGMMFADVMLLIGVGATILSVVLTGVDWLLAYPRMEPDGPLTAGWLTLVVGLFMAVALAYSSQSDETLGLFLGLSFASFVSLLGGLLLLLVLATGLLIASRQRRPQRTEAR
jgi:hypothetical protein